MSSNLAPGVLAALLITGAAAAQPADNQAAPAATNSAGPSTSAPAPAAAPATPAAPASHPASTGAIDIPAPPEGKGEVVFFRKSAFQGMAVWFNVREDGKALGKLTNGVYFVQVADPGPHSYTAATENKDTLRLEVDPGETYFVEGRVAMGIMIGEANLAPSDQATFDKASKHLKLAKPPADDSAPAGK